MLLRLLRSGQEVTCQIAPKKGSEPTQRMWTELMLSDVQAHHHPAIVRWFDAKTGSWKTLRPTPPRNSPSSKKQLADLRQNRGKSGSGNCPPCPTGGREEAGRGVRRRSEVLPTAEHSAHAIWQVGRRSWIRVDPGFRNTRIA